MDITTMDRTLSNQPLLASDNDSGIEEHEDLPLELSELRPIYNGRISENHCSTALLVGDGRPILIAAVMLEFLQTFDKSGIGYAKLNGLDEALGIDYFSWEWVVVSYYLSFFLGQWVNLFWLRPQWSLYIIPVFTGLWTFVSSIQCIVTDYTELLVFRALMGFAEAGFQTMPLLLAGHFQGQQLSRAVGIFVIARPVVTSVTAPLASLVTIIGEHFPIISAWRFVLLFQGLLGMFVTMFSIQTMIPSGHQQISDIEDAPAQQIKEAEYNEDETPSQDFIRDIFCDPASYLLPAMLFILYLTFVPMPVFIGGDHPRALAMPVYLTDTVFDMKIPIGVFHVLVAFPYLGGSLLAAYSVLYNTPSQVKDHAKSICLLALVSVAGYIILALEGHLKLPPWSRYLGIFPATIGFYAMVANVISWTLRRQGRQRRRKVVAFSLLQIGQWGPAFAVRLCHEWERPFYVRGMWSCAVAMLGVAAISLFERWRIGRTGKRIV